MIDVPNVDSVAAMRVLSSLLGRRVGPSTGTNFIGMLTLACRKCAQPNSRAPSSRCCVTRASATFNCFEQNEVTP
jgi:cysteine synthase A